MIIYKNLFSSNFGDDDLIIMGLNSIELTNDEYLIFNSMAVFNNKLDLIYGNLVFTKKNKIIRRWNAGKYTNGSFLKGWSPPHPSFIVKKNVYKKYGLLYF